ncbi:hypothetical protein KY345_05570 [Candidatus Woesearchaeota archaeon]|nr:hypothetical protein [Candidatus Woesearchaeota archaeon]
MVRLAERKDGVFYTITALLLMGVFLFGFLSITKYRYSTKALVIETRVNTINDFISDVERDIQRAVYITSYRCILSMTQMITINQDYVDNVESRFEELFFNGTYQGSEPSFMTNNTFTLWEQRIEEKASELDIDIEFADKAVSVGQEDPWHVSTELNFTLYIGDVKGTANFTKSYSVEADVPIEYFEDPTYRLNTNGLVIKAIQIQNNTDFVNGSDTTNLEIHNNETMYIAFSDAPGYMKRLEGDLSADENGIESLVNIDEFIVNGVNVSDKSIVDYIYFGGSNPAKYHVQGLDSWFKIDNESNGNMTHLELYEVENIIN